MKIGAHHSQNGSCTFSVWAPFAKSVELVIASQDKTIHSMEMDKRGYWRSELSSISPGTQYAYRLNGETERPDPASFYQPNGVHTPSAVVSHSSFQWTDNDWKSPPMTDLILYEIHIGTFTPEGTFAAAVERLDDLVDLGINAVEIMPVAQFPGTRNWGYDGVYPFAAQNSYGGPEGLKLLVDACHAKGISVILDVVYNHLGPEGNYLHDFGPYFTDRYVTPWGSALNFDGPFSNEVRNFFITNALSWMEHYHIDGLRLDAVHGIFDFSARHVLRELAETVARYSETTGKPRYLIAESDLNNPAAARPVKYGGQGINSVWCDDFHHIVHTLLTGEQSGYYADYNGTEQLVKSLKEGYIYTGQYSPYRRKNHGDSSADLPVSAFVVFTQNHDQTGNRMNGERLSSLVSYEAQKLAAGIMLMSPCVPLLFMGEEYGETAPFLYFVDHSDTNLIEGVRQGRKKEFAAFQWDGEPPDPLGEDTYRRSKLRWEMRGNNPHAVLLNFYKALIQMRKSLSIGRCKREEMDAWADKEKQVIFMKQDTGTRHVLALFNFGQTDTSVSVPSDYLSWEKIFDSSLEEWGGPGALLPPILESQTISVRAESCAVYTKSTQHIK